MLNEIYVCDICKSLHPVYVHTAAHAHACKTDKNMKKV